MLRTPFNQGWQTRPHANFFAEMVGASAEWQPVRLPHDATLNEPRTAFNGGGSGYFPGGVHEYRKVFAVPAEYRQRQVGLEFEGWYAGAGIHRPVHLVVGELLHIALDGVRVITKDVDADSAVVEVVTTVEHAGRGMSTVEVVTELRDTGGAAVATDRVPVSVLPGEAAVVRRRLLVPRPALWSPDSPVLHTATLALHDRDSMLDEDSVVFGIRTLDVDPVRGLRINGKPVKLRGATVFLGLDREVTVAVDGQGVLQGFGSAAPSTEESYTDDMHTTFDGRALAVVRPTGPGETTVTVSAGGCESVRLAVQAR